MAVIKMLLMATVLACCSLVPGEAASMAELQDKIAALQTQVAAAQTTMASVQNNLRTTIDIGVGDAVYVLDAHLASATKCGPHKVTDWKVNLDKFYEDESNGTTSSSAFANGRFTAPVTGWYKICSFFRFRNTGNSNDVTIRKRTDIVAAFGNAIQYDWRSTGTCTIQHMKATEPNLDYIEVYHESGGSSDCIEETGWLYGRFNVHLVACSGPECETAVII